MAGRYKKLKKPVFCPNATTLGFSKYVVLDDDPADQVTEGDLIVYKEHLADGSYNSRLARVIGLATHDGCGVEYTKPSKRGKAKPTPRLLVIAANDMLDYAYERHVDVDDVIEVRSPPDPTFTRWFLSGKLPSIDSILALGKYGGLCDRYFSKYVDGNGDLRDDWREKAKGGGS